MKAFEGGHFTDNQLARNISRYIRKKGLIRRKSIETLKIHPLLWRPFRVISWEFSYQNNSRTKSSLLDEQLAPFVSDPYEQVLLWRPRYIGIRTLEKHTIDVDFDAKEHKLDSVIMNILKVRKEARNSVDEISTTLRPMQKNPTHMLSAFIPRSPTGLRKEEELAEERRISYSLLLAISLMTNSSESDIITGYEIGECIHVGTIVASFWNSMTNKTRLVFLETPGALTIDESLRSGNALTRLCQINNVCQNYIKDKLNVT